MCILWYITLYDTTCCTIHTIGYGKCGCGRISISNCICIYQSCSTSLSNRYNTSTIFTIVTIATILARWTLLSISTIRNCECISISVCVCDGISIHQSSCSCFSNTRNTITCSTSLTIGTVSAVGNCKCR